jgi:precorrin-6B methylase 2
LIKLGDKKLLDKCIANWQLIQVDEPIVNRIKMYENLDKYFDLYSAIIYFCYEIPVKKYLEIGVRNCASMIQAVASKPVKRVIGIDLWNSNYANLKSSYNFAKDQMSFSKKDIELIKGDSKKEIPKLKESFELITIDGDHTVEGLSVDIENCFLKLNKKGAIIIDDINHPTHGKSLLPFVRSKYNEWKKEFNIIESLHGNGILIFYRGFNVNCELV